MRNAVRVAILVLLAWGSVAPAGAGSFPTYCQAMPWFRDNLTVKADVPDGALRIDKEGSFRVYLLNTMTGFSFFDAKLGVFSDQFDAEVSPSPAWKTFPDLPPAGKGVAAKGSVEYFTVTLKRKSGVPDGAYDILIKLYARAHDFKDHALAATLSLGEAVDAQTVPVRAEMAVDGKPTPAAWAGSLLAKDFLAYRQNGKGVMSFGPASPTRIHVAADAGSLRLLAHFMGEGKNGELKMYVASGIEETPRIVTLDQATGRITADVPLDGAQSLACRDGAAGAGDAMYEASIPLAALGLAGKKSFFLNFARIDRRTADDPAPEISYWRGNAVSVNQPVVYAHAKLAAAGGVAAAAQPAVVAPAARDDFAESLIPCVLPLASALSADGKVSPAEWADSFVFTGLRPYSKDGDVWRSGMPELSRIQMAADGDNLHVLFTFMTRSRAGSLKLLVAPSTNAAPVWVAIDRAKGKLTSSVPTNGMVAVRCDDDDFLRSPPSRAAFFSSVTYECRIPRSALGIEGQQGFLANAEFNDYPAYWMGKDNTALLCAFWRGNPDTAADPATYGRFAFGQ